MDFSSWAKLSLYHRKISSYDLNPTLNSESEVSKELRRVLLKDGKKVRPLLCFFFGDIFGLTHEQILPYAKTVEMAHISSLIHDDVIDGSFNRRGVSTINATKGNRLAILAGDYLLCQIVSEIIDEGRKDIMKDLTSTIQELVDGEWLEAELGAGRLVSKEELFTVARKKTASLMRLACMIPAKIAKGSEEEIQTCALIGEKLGIGFQMLDDIRDFSTNSGRLFASDLLNGHINFVSFAMMQINPSLIEPLWTVRQRKELEVVWSERQLLSAKESVREQAMEIFRECRLSLEKIIATRNSSKISSDYGVIFDELLSAISSYFTA